MNGAFLMFVCLSVCLFVFSPWSSYSIRNLLSLINTLKVEVYFLL